MNYYDFLEVNPNASLEVIRASYRTLSKKYHPDNYGDDGTMMKRLNEAFDVLSDADKRKKYDMQVDVSRAGKNNDIKSEQFIPGDTILDKIVTVLIGTVYFVFQGVLWVVQVAWGIIVLLLIIGFFTGHSQELFGKFFDWISSLFL